MTGLWLLKRELNTSGISWSCKNIATACFVPDERSTDVDVVKVSILKPKRFIRSSPFLSSNGNDSQVSSVLKEGLIIETRKVKVESSKKQIFKVISSIGGDNGWYYANFLWSIRGYIDLLVGGVGLRRGRTHPSKLKQGDALDFWRVLYTDPVEGRLLLFAEMKLPGEAWLEFKVVGDQLHQTATFRPLGLAGRLYWYSVLMLHGYIFTGLLNRLAQKNR